MYSDKTIRRESKFIYPYLFVQKIRKTVAKKYRGDIVAKFKAELEPVTFTIFSNNCIAGYLYHDAGKQFTSPTINLSFDGECFIKFLENPKHYIDYPMKFIEYKDYHFPIAIIDDIEVHFVHYKTPEQCIEKWKTRFGRVIWDNIFIIATNVDGLYDPKLMERFDKLPYKNKIMFVSKEYPEYDWAIPTKEFMGRFQVRPMPGYANMKGQRYYETNFDIAKWIRENSNEKYINDQFTE